MYCCSTSCHKQTSSLVMRAPGSQACKGLCLVKVVGSSALVKVVGSSGLVQGCFVVVILGAAH